MESLDFVHQWSKAGLMVRDSVDDDAANFFHFVTPDDVIHSTFRATKGNETVGVPNALTKQPLPIRLRVERSGNTFSSSYKLRGGQWTANGNQTLSLSSTILLDIATSSHDAERAGTAAFSSFTVNDAPTEALIALDWDTQTERQQFPPIQVDGSGIDIRPEVDAKPLAHLNRFEMTNLLNDLHEENSLTFDLNADDARSGFEVGLSTTRLGIEKFQTAAEIFAQAEAAQLKTELTCNPTSNAACLPGFLERQMPDYFRQPLARDQRDYLNAVYQSAAATLNHQLGLQTMLESAVQSASFLYHFEDDGVGMRSGTKVPVTGYSMAKRLAATLWGSGPDTQLMNAAANGTLITPAQIRAQAERMVRDPKAKRGFQQFYLQWLGLEEITRIERQTQDLTLTSQHTEAMLDGIQHYVDQIVFSNDFDGSLQTLLSAAYVGNNIHLAPFTGIQTADNAISLASTAGSDRSGLLGQPALLTLLAHKNEGSIVHRGAFVNDTLLCAGFPPPPDDVPQLDSIDSNNKTTREILDELTSPVLCIGCHQHINPIGGVMESFDHVGRYRTTDDQGMPVDTRADILSRQTGQVTTSVSNLNEFNQFLANSDAVKTCFATKYLSYATGHIPSATEQPSITWLVEQMQKHQWRIQDLVVETTQTPLFLYKQVP